MRILKGLKLVLYTCTASYITNQIWWSLALDWNRPWMLEVNYYLSCQFEHTYAFYALSYNIIQEVKDLLLFRPRDSNKLGVSITLCCVK